MLVHIALVLDPKAEAVVGMYPYCAMGNNPISQVGPKGDPPVRRRLKRCLSQFIKLQHDLA
jgi:hypothetical protein